MSHFRDTDMCLVFSVTHDKRILVEGEREEGRSERERKKERDSRTTIDNERKGEKK